ncbi:hypothetical protein C8A03DRAFT_18498 [Achaetomium macrosporum]|uniref:Uncharacterized protein n=1 Tax=Achaetomium macrosporum TaxID=79813 RepID=A0AAN7C3N4_9PEZI|nr:hypothetical protein C8A03DRAFT_18498 [Achaetomium macrosporum]
MADSTPDETRGGLKKNVWAELGDPTLPELCLVLGNSAPDAERGKRPRVIEEGQPLNHEPVVTLRTLGSTQRPRYLYRVVHDDMPFRGLKARGYGTVVADPLFFQIFIQKYLEWDCQSKSPFLSLGTTIDKVLGFTAAL